MGLMSEFLEEKRKMTLTDEERKLLDSFIKRVPDGLRMSRIFIFTDLDPAYKITMHFDYASETKKEFADDPAVAKATRAFKELLSKGLVPTVEETPQGVSIRFAEKEGKR